MTPDALARGGAAVASMAHLDPWEASLVQHLRLWCEGPKGRSRIWSELCKGQNTQDAQRQCGAFDDLLTTIMRTAHRPFVRHEVCCGCVGSDECVFLNLVRTASDGFLNDAALIATLLVGPAHAEQVAILSGQVGDNARHRNKCRKKQLVGMKAPEKAWVH